MLKIYELSGRFSLTFIKTSTRQFIMSHEDPKVGDYCYDMISQSVCKLMSRRGESAEIRNDDEQFTTLAFMEELTRLVPLGYDS